MTLDLTGLPPTLAEVDAFLADRSESAYKKVVDRLLRSTRYGEHMSRFWLDLARFGDTHGMHLDNYREMWPYRDWVIRAFNANKSYDAFITEQLAGDLLPGEKLENLVATGFNRAHVTTNEGGSITEEIHIRNVIDRVETTGTVFLGLTIGCCRCHDHKYDPVTMKDFYSLSAFFNSVEGSPLDGNATRHPPVIKVPTADHSEALAVIERKIAEARKNLADKAAAFVYDDRLDEKGSDYWDKAGIHTRMPQAGASFETLSDWHRAQKALKGVGLPPELKALLEIDKAKRTTAQQKQLRDYFVLNAWTKSQAGLAPFRQKVTALEAERAMIDQQTPVTYVFKETSTPIQAYILKRGEYDQRGAKVGRETPGFLPPLPASAKRDRLALARWMLTAEHPLTTRVAVNRYWQQVFGTGLVKTAEDFGVQGEPPSHPELLDWLAVEFRESGWDVKALMRLLVTSAAYRQSSRVTKVHLVKDPGNRLLSRGPRFRLDAEMLRDQALFVSGLLVEKQGGPSVKPPQPPGLWKAVAFVGSNTMNFVADRGTEKVHRRSLYTFWKRTSPPPQMSTFDAPSREACTVRRERTNTPLQALLLLNEPQYVEAARALAGRTIREGGKTPSDQIAYMFRLASLRKPDAKELAELLAALHDLRSEYARNPAEASKLIAIGETKPDARIPPVELAAWTMLASTILNLDEVLNKG